MGSLPNSCFHGTSILVELDIYDFLLLNFYYYVKGEDMWEPRNGELQLELETRNPGGLLGKNG